MAFSVHCLMFAAGFSRRFGCDKRFVELAPGVSLWQRSLAPLLAANLDVTVVVRPGEASRFEAARQVGAALFEAPRADEGLGGAIASAVPALANADGALIALGDMPWLDSATVRRVAALLPEHAIVAPTFAGRPAHPVGFQRSLFNELGQLSGDQGGRAIIRRHAQLAFEIAIADSGAVRDVDHPIDLLP